MQLDKFQRCAVNSTVAAAILGNVHNGDFQLWPIDVAIPEDSARRFHVRGLCFLGIIGLPTLDSPNGNIEVIDPLPPMDMIRAITAEFDRLFGVAADALMGDSIPWLERLARLPDTRGGFEA